MVPNTLPKFSPKMMPHLLHDFPPNIVPIV
jgi:hypothetical protein